MKKRWIIPIAILIVIVASCGIYVGQYYHTDPAVQSWIENTIADPDDANSEQGDASAVQGDASDEQGETNIEPRGTNDTGAVQISEFSDGLLLDGPAEDTAFIFYPGAKVEYTAYAKLLYGLAESGAADCFLVKMPCNLAILGKSKADGIMQSYSYKHWILGGHSLGGAMAAIYAAEHDLDGLVLLAAYTTKEVDEPTLEIYGSEDGVLNMQKLRDGDKLYTQKPLHEVIEGGNHAQFGDYGEQKGDGKATIAREKQQQITIEKIESLINSVN